jgi:hypothetical protein
VFHTKTGKTIDLNVSRRIVSAMIMPDGGRVAWVSEGNRYGIYDFRSGESVVSYRGEPAITADMRIANPMMLEKLLLIPTLDGKLVILNAETGAKVRDIVVGKGEAFNNIIFLKVIGDRLVAATPHRIISVSPKIMDAQAMEISDVIFVSGAIYILAKDGNVYQCDEDLKIEAKKKFPFAHFVGAIYGEFVYLVEKQGYIIAIDRGLTVANVFELPESIERPFFTTADAFYYDNHYFKLNRSTVEAAEAQSAADAEAAQTGARPADADTETDAERPNGSETGDDSIWDSIKKIFTPSDDTDVERDD